MKYVCRVPGPKSRKIIARDQKQFANLTRAYSFVYDHAKGCYIWDTDGNKYLDFAAGVAVISTGHQNPSVVAAVKKQASKAIHCGFSDFYAELPVKFMEEVNRHAPKNLNHAFLSNSGTEAVEALYKCARWHSNKKTFIAFDPCFHGRTMGSLSLTKSKPIHKKRFEPFLPVMHTPYAYCFRCPWGLEYGECGMKCVDALEKTVKMTKSIAGIIYEPVSGEGGYVVPPKEFLKGVEKIAYDNDILLCADEVQAGCYRTGTFLASENFKVKPDIVSMAKAIGGGVPLGLTLANRSVMDWVPGAHANTMGGNFLAMAAGTATLKEIRKKKLGKNAQKIGAFMLKKLEKMKQEFSCIADVRGLGLMIGIEFGTASKCDVKKRQMVLCEAASRGLLLLPAGKGSVRMSPPLTLTKKQALEGLEKFEQSL